MNNAAGWLVSTLDDLWAFARTMAAGGAGLLSPTSFELLTTDRLTAAQRTANALFLGDGAGWGLGMATPLDGRGGFGWDGGTGHHVADGPVVRRHRHPAHPAGDDVPATATGVRRLLGRDALKRPDHLAGALHRPMFVSRR